MLAQVRLARREGLSEVGEGDPVFWLVARGAGLGALVALLSDLLELQCQAVSGLARLVLTAGRAA